VDIDQHSAAMEKYRYEPLDLGRPAIRLLCLHRGGRNNKISCELFQAELRQRGDTVSYEALSYTWGSPCLTESIIVNGCYLEITLHLYEALQHLRRQDEDRVLWVDAVCIDQENKKERGHQVEQMSKIYKEADRVIFWLGLATLETDIFMESLQLLQRESFRYACRDWSLQDDRWKFLWASMESSFKVLHAGFKMLQRQGLLELLERPWFRRVWILQEVALAKAGIISCGTKSVSVRLFGLTPLLLEIKPSTHCQSVLDIMPSPWRKTSWWSQGQNFRTLLLNFGDSEATESRDLVYALRGMSSDARGINTLFPDYEKAEEYLIRDVVQFTEHCELGDLGLAVPPLTIRDLIKCLRDRDLSRCMALVESSLPQDMEMLLKKPEVRINENIVKTAVAYDETGDVVEVLLRYREREFIVSDDVLISAANNLGGGKKIFEVLCHYQGERLIVSEKVLIAAAENIQSGDSALSLLLSYQGDGFKIEEGLLLAAAKNKGCGDRVLYLLLSYQCDRLLISQNVLIAAVENMNSGDKILSLLLSYQDDGFKIEERLLIAAAKNEGCGDRLLYLLLSYQGGRFVTSEKMLIAATKNKGCGYEAVKLILSRRVEAYDTDSAVVSAAWNNLNGNKIAKVAFDFRLLTTMIRLLRDTEISIHTIKTASRDQEDAGSVLDKCFLQFINGLTTEENQGMWMLLRFAVQKADVKVIELLFIWKTNIEEADKRKRQPRDMYCLANLVDIEAKDIYGQSLLALAVETGSYSMVKTLLRYGADAVSQDIYGRTPLTIATACRHTKLVDLLSKYGTDATTADDGGTGAKD
jgi:hypothetical protein